MKNTWEEILRRKINDYDGDDLATFVLEIMGSKDDIELSIKRHFKARQKEKERRSAITVELNENLYKIQKKCPHYMTTYYPDASGNNDSETLCDWCGASV